MRILKGQGLAPTLPEDLYCLIKKAVSVRKHLERKPQGHGLQVSIDFDRIPNPQIGEILQTREEVGAELEVRVFDSLHALDEVNVYRACVYILEKEKREWTRDSKRERRGCLESKREQERLMRRASSSSSLSDGKYNVARFLKLY